MDALYAGLMAWTIEASIVLMVLLMLRFEENKVIKNRNSKTKRVKT